MKRISLLIVAMFAMIAFSQPLQAGDFTKAEFANIVKTENESCPIEISDGLTLSSIELDGDVLIFRYDTNESADLIQTMETYKDDLKQSTLEDFKNDPDMMFIANECRDLKISIKTIFYDKTKTHSARVTIPWQEL